MKDSHGQTDAQSAYASQPSALRERLVRLLTEPVGVIDVRYALQKYARIAEWLDKRSALLEHLHSRYGVGEGLVDDNQPLLMQDRLEEAVNFHSTTFQSFPTVQPFSTELPPSAVEQSAMRTTTHESSAQPFSPAEHTQTYADSATAQTSSEAFPGSSDEAPLLYTSGRVTDVSQLPEGEFRVSRRRAQFNPSPVLTPAPTPELPLADTHARTEAVADAPLGSEPVVAREVSQTESVKATPRVSTPALPLAYARPAVLTAKVLEENERPSEQTTDSRPTSTQPIARTVNAANESESVKGTRESVEGKRESAVAAEIKDASFTQASPEIVWRQGSSDAQTTDADSHYRSNNSGGSTTSDARQIDGHPFERRAQSSLQTNSSVKRREQESEIRFEQLSPRVINTISEKVMRAISHDLAIELERRGLKKWR